MIKPHRDEIASASIIVLLLLAGCLAQVHRNGPIPDITNSPSPIIAVNTATFLPATLPPSIQVTEPGQVIPSTTPNLSPTVNEPIRSPIPQNQVCSPLKDVPLDRLEGIITNPFVPSSPVQEGFHTGIDLSFYHFGTHDTILGLPVYSALTGRVVAVNPDRPPYGNMVIVETPLNLLPTNFIQSLTSPLLETPSPPDPRLTCPVLTPDPAWISDQVSLYILYAHLNKPALVARGDQVACGQPLGEVGNSGNDPSFTASGNPHLHFELRQGPSGASFDAMSHHNNQATPKEIYSYCMWRVSGFFRTIDPLKLVNSGLK